jgi:porin
MLLPVSQAGAEGVPKPTIGRHLLETPELLGNPAGARSRLEQLGIVLQLFYNQNLSGKPSGGGTNPNGVFGHSGSYDLLARVDLEELVGWRGGDFLLHVRGMYDRNLNADVGSLSQPIDDADYDEPIYVDELWIRQTFFDGRLRFRVGILEQQTIFDRNAFANSEDRQFLTSFLDNNAVVPLPNGIGATVIAVPLPWLEIALGVANADNFPGQPGIDTTFDQFEGVTGHLELKLASPFSGLGLSGHTRLGAFIDGRERTHFETGRERRGHFGAYLSFDQRVWRESEVGPQGLGVFARAGYADRNYHALAWFWSLGGQYTGLVPGRDDDVLGFACYQALGSSVYRDEIDPSFERETGIELYYRIAALPWLAITPDFQYILDPGATGAADDAFVGTLRVRVTF